MQNSHRSGLSPMSISGGRSRQPSQNHILSMGPQENGVLRCITAISPHISPGMMTVFSTITRTWSPAEKTTQPRSWNCSVWGQDGLGSAPSSTADTG